MKAIEEIYENYPFIPYINPERSLEEINRTKPVPKKNLDYTVENLLPGAIILLWRIHFGTFTTDSFFPKYFEYTYGINGEKTLLELIEEGYVSRDSANESLRHHALPILKEALKEKGIKGLSKYKREEIDQLIKEHFSEDELEQLLPIRGYSLTEKGKKTLADNQVIVARHPQKKF